MSEVRSTSSERTVRRLGVHVLGAADLDRKPPELAEGLAALEALSGDEARWRELTRPPQLVSPGGRRYAMRPLHTVVEAGCDGLLLVATRQDPPHRGDTWPLAELVGPLLRRRGVAARTVEVETFDLNGLRTAVRKGLGRFTRSAPADEVVLNLGGGAKLAFVGALLGLIQAGWTPRLLDPPYEDEPLVPPRELGLKVSLVPWLVRTQGRFWPRCGSGSGSRARSPSGPLVPCRNSRSQSRAVVQAAIASRVTVLTRSQAPASHGVSSASRWGSAKRAYPKTWFRASWLAWRGSHCSAFSTTVRLPSPRRVRLP